MNYGCSHYATVVFWVSFGNVVFALWMGGPVLLDRLRGLMNL